MAIPRTLWSYWDGPPSATVDACVASAARCNPAWSVRLLTPATVDEALGFAPPAWVHRLEVRRRSDWLRLALLAARGGAWADASTLHVRPLETALGPGVNAYELERFRAPGCGPVLESWFVAAPRGAPFVVAWFRELHAALEAHGDDGAAYYRAACAADPTLALRHRIDVPGYLTIHVAALVVLGRDPGLLRGVTTHTAERGPYLPLARWGWDFEAAMRALAYVPARDARFGVDELSSFVKIRGNERALIDMGIASGAVHPRSHWAALTAGSRLRRPARSPHVLAVALVLALGLLLRALLDALSA